MTFVVMFFAMAVGAALQALFPTMGLLGQMQPPILFGLVLYYALTRPPIPALMAAMLAGFLQDAFSLIPLGYSSFAFGLAALGVNHFREEVFGQQWITHLLFGSLGYLLVCMFLSALLVSNGHLLLTPSGLIRKFLGAAILGAVSAPLVFRVIVQFEQWLGIRGEARV